MMVVVVAVGNIHHVITRRFPDNAGRMAKFPVFYIFAENCAIAGGFNYKNAIFYTWSRACKFNKRFFTAFVRNEQG